MTMRRGFLYYFLMTMGLLAVLVTWVMGPRLFPSNHEVIRLTVVFLVVVSVLVDLVAQGVQRRSATRKR